MIIIKILKKDWSNKKNYCIIRNVRPAWRNGRRDRLKIYCQRWREGSSPLAGTIKYINSNIMLEFLFCMLPLNGRTINLTNESLYVTIQSIQRGGFMKKIKDNIKTALVKKVLMFPTHYFEFEMNLQ